MITELVLPYDRTQVADKVSRRRRRMIGRVISLVLTVVIIGGIYLWQRSRDEQLSLVVSLVVIGIAVALLVAYLIAYLLARRELRGVGSGLAVRIGRPGVEVAGLFAAWPDVVTLAAVRAKVGGPQLELKRADGSRASVPFNQIEIFPATLDSTVRAYSGGRHGVDLHALDT